MLYFLFILKNILYLKLRRRLMCTQSKLIDTRESCFFNGWPEDTYTVGGHIHGALNFSVSWLNQLTDQEIMSQLEKNAY